ncbi:MAG: hypothetical protein ISS81_10075 [Candidatus Marinimicrobia bacterium]|nr:hypothetical protein [Candidatus Neomarinimicrobiota bacterium]
MQVNENPRRERRLKLTILYQQKNRIFPVNSVVFSDCFPTIERVKGIEPSYKAWGFCDICRKKIKAGVHTIHLAMEAHVWEHMREWDRKDEIYRKSLRR